MVAARPRLAMFAAASAAADGNPTNIFIIIYLILYLELYIYDWGCTTRNNSAKMKMMIMIRRQK